MSLSEVPKLGAPNASMPTRRVIGAIKIEQTTNKVSKHLLMILEIVITDE
jgi:hypothetical protein